jgi:hypothetical protein
MKIKTYFIPPLKHLELSLKGDRLYALAHFVLEGNQEYIDFFKKQKRKFITLDSGVAEGHRVPTDTFMRCAKEIGAKEIICPDELWDMNRTIYLTRGFLNSLSGEERRHYKFMLVPQAKNIKDYVKIFSHFQNMDRCSCIGISKFDAPNVFGKETDKHIVYQSRVRLINYLYKNNLIKKPIHCLGYDNPLEFKYYVDKGYDFIRSCDSASAILCAKFGLKFNKQNGIEERKPSGGDRYFNYVLKKQELKMALHNIMTTKRLCKDGL